MNEKKFDVTALGELLIDFTENGVSGQGNGLFEANPGGAPCNVLAMLKKLDRSCAFIGKVGDDMFGHLLRDVALEAGICMDYLVFDQNVHTTLAFVHTFPNGDRDFSFYRNPGADMMLTEDELPLDVIADSRIFHFGTLSMTHEGVRKATCRAIDHAKQSGAIISFDPNLRPPLWDSLDEAKKQIEYGLARCDVLKIADNELDFITGRQADLDRGPDFLLAQHIAPGIAGDELEAMIRQMHVDRCVSTLRAKYPNIKLLNVTAGADGSYSYYEDKSVFVPACKLGGTIETTGAGDTFCASVLSFVLGHGLDGLTEADLTDMLRFANTAAYLVTTRRGAIRSMPERSEVEKLLQ